MVPSGLALGINKQTWEKNDSYNNLTMKSRSGEKKKEKEKKWGRDLPDFSAEGICV